MGDSYERDEFEPWITNWEQQCIEEVESSPDLAPHIDLEKDRSAQKLWLLFQNAATCIAQLYKDRQQGISLWIPFQNAAGSVTNLHKECIESQRNLVDLGVQLGSERRSKEVLAWAKRRKRHIRREDLISFLAGKNPPHRIWGSPRPRLCLDGTRNSPHHSLARISFSENSQYSPHTTTESDLQTFREALSLSSLNGASGGLRSHGQSGSPPRGNRARSSSPNANQLAELNAFIAEEFTRHLEPRKRAASTDVVMDSPTHKRSRLI